MTLEDLEVRLINFQDEIITLRFHLRMRLRFNYVNSNKTIVKYQAGNNSKQQVSRAVRVIFDGIVLKNVRNI